MGTAQVAGSYGGTEVLKKQSVVMGMQPVPADPGEGFDRHH